MLLRSMSKILLMDGVSATSVASLVSSLATGVYLSGSYGDSLIVLVVTVVDSSYWLFQNTFQRK